MPLTGILSYRAGRFTWVPWTPRDAWARVAFMLLDGPSVPQCFLDALDRRGDRCAQMYRSAAGWQSISAQEMLRRVAGLAKAADQKPLDKVREL